MYIGDSIFGMAVKSTIFNREVEMDKIAGIGNFNIPIPYQLNKMTLAMIKDKDGDGDSVLSAKELDVPEDVFTKIDANSDGNADSVELNAYYPISKIDIPTLQLIKDKDTDGDKVLSGEELGVTEDILKEIDANSDGNADREELNAAHPLTKLYNILAYQPPPAKGAEDGIDVTV
ncbi:MAG: hypothetical protein Q6358_13910 [Candidatus Brocadiales bacterium]|nr:hypothetical protein [Candidatus Brocadiales bacterium]